MEALSGVASGIAVVSLSIQLVQSVGSIKAFIRNVKDAQKELERLIDLLERLEALLEDVRALMERQASLEHFPTPSATIFKCLKSCEKTLEPLQATVDKYTPSKSKVGTSVDRLKNGLRIGFKAKDIQDFETRIEREINFLHASLGANCGAILIQLGPALLKSRSNQEAIHQSSTVLTSPKSDTVAISSMRDDGILSNTRAIYTSLSIVPVRSSLEKFGIYQRKIVRRIPYTLEKVAPGGKKGDEAIVSEDHETTLLWSVLGYGLSWIQHRSFGRVLPSLSTFPVVRHFGREIDDVLLKGEIQDFQDLLHRGVIHPFSHDAEGRSLLHMAAEYHRADIYALLRNLGLKQNVSIYGESPLSIALETSFDRKMGDLTAIYRYALEDPDLVCNFIEKIWYHPLFTCRYYTNSVLWMYQESVNRLPREDSCIIRACIFWQIWFRMLLAVDSALPLVEYPSLDLDVETLDVLRRRGQSFLTLMFRHCWNSHDSFILGNKLLEWISNSGINVEQLISHEAELANESYDWARTARRFTFEPQKEGGWKLGFEYVFDREASDYLLVSEYEAIIATHNCFLRWLIYDSTDKWSLGYWERTKKQNSRFQRRMAAKARKQSGQKRYKRTMPGAWVH